MLIYILNHRSISVTIRSIFDNTKYIFRSLTIVPIFLDDLKPLNFPNATRLRYLLCSLRINFFNFSFKIISTFLLGAKKLSYKVKIINFCFENIDMLTVHTVIVSLSKSSVHTVIIVTLNMKKNIT